MTPRQRVLAALDHAMPDAVPVDFGSTNATSIHVVAYLRLLDHLGIPDSVRVLDRHLQRVDVCEAVLERFGVATRGLALGPPDAPAHEELPDDGYRDEWGIVRRRPPGGIYYDLEISPFAGEATSADLGRHQWPDPNDPGWTRGLAERASILAASDHAIVFSPRTNWLTVCQFLRGFEGWFEDLLLRPALFCELADRVIDIQLSVAGRALAMVGDAVDVLFFGDDLGSQHGPMMSLRHYRELIRPRQKRVLEFLRGRSAGRVVYHTCGSALEFIDDLIELGVDALNPVQVSAAGMDTVNLKRRFGDRIAFWGAIDTQQVLPHGTPEDVRREVRRRIGDLGPTGYVLAAVQNIQPGVPPANIVALFDAAREYGGG